MHGIIASDRAVLGGDGQFRPVVFGAEMRDGHPLGSASPTDAKEFSCFLIGDVSTASANARLEHFGVGTGFEHVRVVIGFEINGVERFQNGRKAREGMPQIGENAESFSIALDDEHDSVGGVVGRGYRVDVHATEGQRFARAKMPNVVHSPEFAPTGRERSSRDVHRQPELPLKDTGALDVIDVIVGNDDGLHVANVASVGGHSFFRGDAADAGVEEQPRSVGLDVDAVSVGPGLQGERLHEWIIIDGWRLEQSDCN